MEDEILATVARANAALDYKPQGGHDWEALDELFVDRAVMALRFFPGDPDVCVLAVRDFLTHPRRDNALRDGYSETLGACSVERIGDVALVVQHLTMAFADRPPAAAVDAFTLARIGGTWRIVSFLSDAHDER